MSTTQPRLPTIGKGRKRAGRHRRQFDHLAKLVREHTGRGRADVETELAVARGLADELDRLEADPEHSAHTFALVSRTYHDLRMPLHARIAPTAAGDGADPLEMLTDGIAAALRHTAAS